MNSEELGKLIDSLLPDSKELECYRNNRKYDHHFLPEYHFHSPGGYLNDPNGYIRYKGLYHLFYQFESPYHCCLCWGHAVSADNIKWFDLPCAVVPTIELCCGSGGVVTEDDRAILCFQGDMKDNPGGAIHIFESRDELLINWKRIGDGPVITTFNSDGSRNPYNAFDPYMWKEGKTYYLLSAGGGSLPHPFEVENLDYRRMYLFSSENLTDWTYIHSFVEDDRFCEIGDDGACPYFLPIGSDKYIMLHFSHMSGGKYMIGRYDKEKKKFFAVNGDSFNSISWYSGVHAPSAYSDGNGGVNCIFNVNYGYIGDGINQIMSIPRKLTLDVNGNLCQRPTDDYSSYVKNTVEKKDVIIPANIETVLDGICGQVYELELTADTAEKNIHPGFIPDNLLPMFELRVLRSDDGSEYSSVRCYRNRGKMNWTVYKYASGGHWANAAESIVQVDTAMSSLSADAAIHPAETRNFVLENDEPFRLRVFVDKSIIEVFVNEKEAISVRAYPTKGDSIGISVISRGVDAKISYVFKDMSEH